MYSEMVVVLADLSATFAIQKSYDNASHSKHKPAQFYRFHDKNALCNHQCTAIISYEFYLSIEYQDTRLLQGCS